jgi:hypothetical protein
MYSGKRRREPIVRWVLSILFIIEFLQGAPALSQEAAGEWVVSIPHLPLAPEEQVVGFEVTFRAARPVTVPQVPFQWIICIDNSAGAPRVKGDAIVGAAATREENFFKDFLVIEKYEGEQLSFSIEVELAIVTADYTASRRVVLSEKDLVLQKKEIRE